MEKRTDMYLSTLRSYIKAMGGDLQIKDVFPEGEVQIEQFQGPRMTHARVDRIDENETAVGQLVYCVTNRGEYFCPATYDRVPHKR